MNCSGYDEMITRCVDEIVFRIAGTHGIPCKQTQIRERADIVSSFGGFFEDDVLARDISLFVKLILGLDERSVRLYLLPVKAGNQTAMAKP